MDQAETELGAPLGRGSADWDVEAFLSALQQDGTLESMRAMAYHASSKRKSALGLEDSSVSELEDWDTGTSSNTEDAASSTTCTESDWGSERDIDAQQLPLSAGSSSSSSTATCVKNCTSAQVVRRWGFKRLVRGSVPAEPAAPATAQSGLSSPSGSCESLPSLESPDPAEILTIPANNGVVEEMPSVIEDSEFAEFLTELQQNEYTAASPAAGWTLVMNRSTSSMQYCSWLRDPGSRGGTEYRGRMIVRGCSPETARDFFLDEAHRQEWDENRLLSQQLEDWDENGCTAVRWVRRLPFFLKNREYVVTRRIWNPEHRVFYCISRQVVHPSAPLNRDTVRASSFHSSWRIKAVEPALVEGGCALKAPAGSACEDVVEMITHHEEESGLQKDLARMGIAHGMWSHILKMERALHTYAASGKNARHLLPIFLIQADARLGLGQCLLDMPRPLEQRHQQQLEQLEGLKEQQALKLQGKEGVESPQVLHVSPVLPTAEVGRGQQHDGPCPRSDSPQEAVKVIPRKTCQDSSAAEAAPCSGVSSRKPDERPGSDSGRKLKPSACSGRCRYCCCSAPSGEGVSLP